MQYSPMQNTGRASGTHISIHVRSLALLWLIASLFVTNAGAQDDAVDFKYLEVKVVDPEGEPMTDVDVEVSIDWAAFPMPTDEDGMIGLNVPSSGAELMLSVQHEGYEVIGARWKKDEEIPGEFTIQLKKGATIGGIVHNEDGNPVEGVSVQGTIYHDNSYPGEEGAGQLRPILKGEIAVTDEEGRWQTASAPHNLVNSRFRLTLEFSHPDYVAGTRFSVDKDVYEPLQAFENIAVLKFGADLRGRVLDPEGNPVAGAKLLLGRHRYVNKPLEAETDKNGTFHIAKAPPGSEVLTIASPDWAPELMDVELERGMMPLDVQLKPGNTIRIRVVDPEGEPIEGVSVYPREWRGHETLDDPSMRRKTDADGIWQWDHAPADEVRYTLGKKGYQSTKEEDKTEFVPHEEPHEVTMLPAVVVTGKVVDKGTGQPIEKFKFWEGIWWDSRYTDYVLQSSNEQVGRDGTYQDVMDNGCAKFLIKVAAEGYFPALSREILPDEGNVQIDFELERGVPPIGVVKLPNGQPAAGLEVYMARPDRAVSISDGELTSRHGLISAVSDVDGRFSFETPEKDFILVCADAKGWAQVPKSAFEISQEIELQPWLRVEGQLLQGQKPLPQEEVSLFIPHRTPSDKPSVYWSDRTETDSEGKFTFEHAKSGTAEVRRLVRYAQRDGTGGTWALSHNVQIEVEPENTSQVVLGGKGRSVRGQLVVPEELGEEVSWKMGIVRLAEESSQDESNDSHDNSSFVRHYATRISADGTYKLHDVRPSDYKVSVTLFPRVLGIGTWKPAGTLEQKVTIPAGDGAEVVDLGKMVLEIPDEKAGE